MLPAVAVVPSRYASTRFPGKPLTDILGKPMFWHVCTQAAKAKRIGRVVLATEDERIMTAAASFGIEAMMTSPDHASGSDRVMEVAEKLNLPDEAVVVNVQGDEPALDPAILDAIVEALDQPGARVSTPMTLMRAEDVANPDRVKVVFTDDRLALYFSRSAIPHRRNAAPEGSIWSRDYGHVGLYAYRVGALKRFTALPPSGLEIAEGLEQLRLLEAGEPIRVVEVVYNGHAVDRPEDVAAVEALLRG